MAKTDHALLHVTIGCTLLNQIKAVVVNTPKLVHIALKNVRKMLLNCIIFREKQNPSVFFVLALCFIARLWSVESGLYGIRSIGKESIVLFHNSLQKEIISVGCT